ncbi:thiazolinyl imide reductase [Lentzea fradiae]|uniref:Thiazolinyl imide reductase n=1 Tax=Lentzea fradiae TaxID=200378 RepID=A0A1G7L1K7_9PSEU|nr:Gfo/Idh/MocA family oxidoreductase [Lentzea fradiae]SDF43251.1 thiazolinyl imide reductase [Lentzea fradiae]
MTTPGTTPTSRRPRVVVCGTSFGRVYLRAVHEDPTVELAGVLSKGSPRSQHYADAYGVPSYHDPKEVPDDVDIACVVVRAGVAGGAGAELAQSLLSQRIHVLQEHLLHPMELAECLHVARRHGVRYRVNAFYPHVEAVRRFLRAARAMRREQPPLFVDAMAGVQVLHPLLDVIARAVGGLRPWRFADASPFPAELHDLARHPGPYTHLHGVVGGTPVSLRVQNHVHPADPDNHALLLHRISLVFESGVLSLADTHGPVLWSPRLHSERDGTGRLIMEGTGTERLQVPATEPLGPDSAPTFRDVFDRVWPDAVRVALKELRADIADERRSTVAGQWALSVAGMWQDVTRRLGEPRFIHPDAPDRVDLPELVAAESKAVPR